MYDGFVVANGSVLSIESIGEGNIALVCHTSKVNCCRDERNGEWYYPNQTRVGINGTNQHFYRTRTDDGEVLLHQRRDQQDSIITGIYCCVIPDSDSNCNVNQEMCVNLGMLRSYA